jgi:hypothetical protein
VRQMLGQRSEQLDRHLPHGRQAVPAIIPVMSRADSHLRLSKTASEARAPH